ncbi:hypothetical protein GIB67_038190 [Kingdonia uniflora]|uniref:Pentatricopeptide repeat-containing protein n=1 Tax=Kingdonia uniflora TaxID=39325 RepID=A0A7J7NHA2_9MAGN|nr:hypothetical protein GIB67_038190 [Kingdonia uniflora]
MVEQGKKSSILSYGALLIVIENGKLFVEEHMIKVGALPNLYAYTIIVSVYSGQGNSEMVNFVAEEMVKARIELIVVTFNVIISRCARNGMRNQQFCSTFATIVISRVPNLNEVKHFARQYYTKKRVQWLLDSTINRGELQWHSHSLALSNNDQQWRYALVKHVWFTLLVLVF